MIKSVEEGYKIYLAECSNRKKWLKECQFTWYKYFQFSFFQKQVDNALYISCLEAMEKVLNLSEKEKRIFD